MAGKNPWIERAVGSIHFFKTAYTVRFSIKKFFFRKAPSKRVVRKTALGGGAFPYKYIGAYQFQVRRKRVEILFVCR